jgi:hypothetical protein
LIALQNLGKTLGALLLLVVGLRFLNVVAIYSFPAGDSDRATRTQIFALLLFGACQLGGGGLLRSLFRKPIPEIDNNEGTLERSFSVLRWSLLFCAVSALAVFLIFIFARGSRMR